MEISVNGKWNIYMKNTKKFIYIYIYICTCDKDIEKGIYGCLEN